MKSPRHTFGPALVPGLLFSSLGIMGIMGIMGCTEQDTQNVPNRVLDRPTDVVLLCADRVCNDFDGDGVETCEAEMRPLSACGTEVGSCTASGTHMIGFVANSERNEVAMFTKCDGSLVDMDFDVPGYNFVPAGILPTELTASDDGCRVVSANVGSCDLTVLDAQGMAHYALDLDPTTDEPSSLVANLEPRRFDEVSGGWVPLGARPGDLISAPLALTTAPGLDPGAVLDGNCDPLNRGSVYVSFPTCNLVAEVDVQTGNILQSRQLVGDGLGGVDVVDTGTTPLCPVECPAQFDGELPSGLPPVDQNGVFPQALELLTPSNQGADEADEADMAVVSRSLFVGGLGSDTLFELRMSEGGIWGEANSLTLQDAGGIKRIRVSPAVDMPSSGSDFSQFIYAIAGDGSTRVIGRELPNPTDSLGIECDTQADPSVIPESQGCIPVPEVPSDGPPAGRRGLARGPGIRPGTGGEITDWSFRKIYTSDDENPFNDGNPFVQPGVVAVGVTTRGEVIYVIIDHPRANGETLVEDIPDVLPGTDPTQVMSMRLDPHSQWPDPATAVGVGGLPTVVDEPSARALPALSGPSRDLSPSLRRIDAAYLDDEGEPRPGLTLGNNGDELHLPTIDTGEGVDPIYEEDAVKIIVRDYRSWFAATWSLVWEGVIVPTRSTGRLDCANPGWEGGTCLVSEPDDSRLIDESATFCEDGVLPGDKLILIGCSADFECGEGRRCLLETSSGISESTGICISGQAYEERAAQLREICGNFIADPCGGAVREFTITKSFQDELWIQAMDQRPQSHMFEYGPCAAGSNNALVGDSCVCLGGFEGCGGEGEALECCEVPGAEAYPIMGEVISSFVCSEEQPNDGCASDDDCEGLPFPGPSADPNAPEPEPGEAWMCVEERCRRPCRSAAECTLRRLPGPTCFGEFVRYQVGLRNAFQVTGPVSFEGDRVDVDPDTGECRPTLDGELSQLLSSRISLPETDDPSDPVWAAIPVCSTDAVEPGNPNPCRIMSEGGRFHNLSYEGETVSALRFSNPVFSLILDLTSVDSLTSNISGFEELSWGVGQVGFERARIPAGYSETFRLGSGYQPFADFLLVEGSRPVTYPVRILAGPAEAEVYIVDGSGPGSSTSIRGQVVRATLGDQVSVDDTFIGVR